MKIQIAFTLDAELKTKALERAKRDGLPLAFVMRHLLRAYVYGDFEISLQPRPGLPRRGVPRSPNAPNGAP